MDLTDEQRERFGKALRHIDKIGWSVQIIGPADDDPEGTPWFAHTIGFWDNFDHPELLVFGLTPDLLHAMLNRAGEQIRDEGLELGPGDKHVGLMGDDLEVTARDVDPGWLPAVAGHMLAMYDEVLDADPDEVAVLQLFWPGVKDGKYPWEDGADDAVRTRQPRLYLTDPEDAGAHDIARMLP